MTPMLQTKEKPLPPTPGSEEDDYVVPCDHNVKPDDPNLKLGENEYDFIKTTLVCISRCRYERVSPSE